MDGVEIQIPISQKDQEAGTTLQEQIDTLIQQPEYSYLNQFIDREDANWQEIILAEESWDYKQEGLTPAGAAIVAIAVGMATGGTASGIANTVAANVGSQTVGAMAGAAFSSLASQASVSLINNKGDVEATLKDLGSKESVKQLTFAIASAGISHKIDKGLGLKGLDITQTGFDQRMVKAIADSTSTSLLQTAVYGGDFEENLKKNLRMQFVAVATQETFSNIVKDLDSDTLSDNIAHKIAAGLTGCLSAKAAGNDCDAGTLGATIGEMWGDWLTDDPNTLTLAQKETIINQAKLIAGIAAAYAGEDVNVAADMAAEAVRWNALNRSKWEVFGQEFVRDCYGQSSGIQACQVTIEKWKKESYQSLSSEERKAWEGFVVEQYQPLINQCGNDAVCQFEISQNMLVNMVKFSDNPKYGHYWINDEIQALKRAIPFYKRDKSEIAILAAHDFGWVVEAGAFSKFGDKTIHFLKPLLTNNRVVVQSLKYVPKDLDVSKLRYAMPSSWFKAAYHPTTKPISIALAEIETSSGRIERVMAVSGNAWHNVNAPKIINWQGYNYTVIFDDLKKLPNRGNENHAEKRIFEYINSTHNNQKIHVKIAVENTSKSSVGMCTGCKDSIQDLSKLQPKMRITMFHGSTKINP